MLHFDVKSLNVQSCVLVSLFSEVSGFQNVISLTSVKDCQCRGGVADCLVRC